jgi:hypothetical protein
MRLILTTNHLGLGGSESYLFTIAEELDRLGHSAAIYTREQGAGAVVARQRGLEVVDDLGDVEDPDAAIVQDAGTSHELAARLPELPQLFVAHSETYDLQLPPQLERQVGVAVALNERVARRLRALAVAPLVVRLRQPIDIEHYGAAGPLPDVPRRALLLSNNPVADRLALIERACAASGLELVRLGGDSGQTDDPRQALANVQIVIGYGRSVLEAMAAGRAAYVYDRYGGDGWVTVDSYPALEADGFAGRERETTVDEARLRSDLRAYAAAMGPANRDLVVANHRANVHAQELVELLRPLAPPQRDRLPYEEMARLVRLEWRARVDAQGLWRELNRRDEQLELSKRQTADAEARTAQVRSSYESTLSWRATERLRAARDLVRRLGGRR